jgi:hypothetical protein
MIFSGFKEKWKEITTGGFVLAALLSVGKGIGADKIKEYTDALDKLDHLEERMTLLERENRELRQDIRDMEDTAEQLKVEAASGRSAIWRAMADRFAEVASIDSRAQANERLLNNMMTSAFRYSDIQAMLPPPAKEEPPEPTIRDLLPESLERFLPDPKPPEEEDEITPLHIEPPDPDSLEKMYTEPQQQQQQQQQQQPRARR